MATVEPSVNSHDKEERIAARRSRIARNQAAQLSEADGDGKTKGRKGKGDGERKDSGKGRGQVTQSKMRLEKMKTAGFEDVTSIRLRQDENEQNRRVEEEKSKQRWKQRLQEEADRSSRDNAAINLQWDPILSLPNIPQDLYAKMVAQKEACAAVLGAKKRLIDELKEQLRVKDDEYVKSLKRQADDIEQLLDRMSRHYREMGKAYEEELHEIEESYGQERSELLMMNKAEIESFFEKRRTMEIRFMDERQQRLEEDQRQLDNLRISDAEDYNVLKIKLETEIQTLEQQQEEMRATYQLNTEKLEYNYRVLIERDQENNNTKAQQKRKISRLQDALSGLMSRYQKTDKQYRQENVELTEQYKRITEQYKDLQTKFRHFEVADQKKHQEVWMMNEETVREMMKRVMEADKVIHEQQLGHRWFPPTDDIFHSSSKAPGSVAADTKTSESLVLESISQEGSAIHDSVKLKSGRTLVLDELSEPVRRMLTMLTTEAGFLVEDKVRRILDGIPKDERERMKVESILGALGITTEEDVQKLLTFFMVSQDDSQLEMINAIDAVKALKSFVEDQRINGQRPGTGRSHVTAKTEADAEAIKNRTRKEEKEFWEALGSVISDDTFEVWDMLEKSLQEYQGILVSRAKLIEETASMRQQNEELKMLLNQYLGAKVNHELILPPTRTLNLDS